MVLKFFFSLYKIQYLCNIFFKYLLFVINLSKIVLTNTLTPCQSALIGLIWNNCLISFLTLSFNIVLYTSCSVLSSALGISSFNSGDIISKYLFNFLFNNTFAFHIACTTANYGALISATILFTSSFFSFFAALSFLFSSHWTLLTTYLRSPVFASTVYSFPLS